MKTVFSQQIHSGNINVIDESVQLNSKVNIIQNCDGLITDLKGVRLGVKTADCLPIKLKDKKRKVIGIIHAGWRGTLKQITENALNIMINRFFCDPKSIDIFIGPSIKQESYLVGDDVYGLFPKVYKKYFRLLKKGFYNFDLVRSNIYQMTKLGVCREKIKVSKIDTFVNKNYPSFRRDKTKKRLISYLMLK